MKTVQATDNLVLQLWPASEVAEYPVGAIRNLAAKGGGEHQTLIVHPHEIRHLIYALAEAACLCEGRQGGWLIWRRMVVDRGRRLSSTPDPGQQQAGR